MRIRTVKPEFFTHDKLFDAENETGLPLRIAYVGLWCAADREGRFKWEPKRIGISVLPYDKVDFSRVLDALVTRGFVVRYNVGECEYGYIPSWQKHQVINNREKDSDIPEPTAETIVANNSDACPTRAPRDDDAGKEEGKGKEGKGTGEADAFFSFWNENCHPLPKALILSPKRRSTVNARLREPFFRDNHQQAIKRLAASEFCQGKNEKNWKADMDFFLRPDVIAKILEGKYDKNGVQRVERTLREI